MRIESSMTSLSWIPLGATEGFNRLSFGLRVAHYDPPPPDVLGDLDELKRFAPSDDMMGVVLAAWRDETNRLSPQRPWPA
jgi:hypothetical protein